MMGSGEADPASDKGSGEEAATSPPVSCSICLDHVHDGGDRSTARLQCGHRFHLDCIGSAFNVKGMMQCPNCRKIEKGNWLYANGRSYPDFGIDEWAYDEDLYDLNYSEMPYGVHWCPYSRLTHLHSSFEEGESTSISYHDVVAHHPFFTEHPAPSSAHSCPYVAYFPLQPSPSASQPTADSGAEDATVFYHHWGNVLGRSDLQSSRTPPAADFYFRGQEPLPSPFSASNGGRASGAEATASAPPAMRPTRLNPDRHLRPGPFPPPFLIGHGSPAATSSVSVGQAAFSRGQPPYQQQRSAPGPPSMNMGMQRSVGTRNMPPPAPPAPPPPLPADNSRFYMLSGAPSLPEVDSFGGGRFYAWERDRFSPFPLVQVERNSSWWGPFQWHSSENRSSSQGRANGGSHRPAQQS